MGLPALEARYQEKPETHIDSDGDDILKGQELLDILEQDRSIDNTARGIANGVVMGTVLWLLAIVTYLLAT